MKKTLMVLALLALAVMACGSGSNTVDTDSSGSGSNSLPPKLDVVATGCTQESGYVVVDGTITNNDTVPFSLVKIYVFILKDGSVVGEDEKYAVGVEGLAPGESKGWQEMISAPPDFDQCGAKLLKW